MDCARPGHPLLSSLLAALLNSAGAREDRPGVMAARAGLSGQHLLAAKDRESRSPDRTGVGGAAEPTAALWE